MKPTTFEEKIIFSGPVILIVFSFVLWVVAFLLDVLTNIPNLLVWLPMLGIQIVISTTYVILINKLHFIAHNDQLTGLCNRRYFNFMLAKEISRIQRTKSILTLILIDIDNFKKVNDTHGHLMGDDVLKKLGYILKNNTRNIDIVARWGGEEFAIILVETDLDGAKIFAERLRKTVENYDFGFQVTISLGIVSTCDDLSLDELLTQADEALYAAKEKKNRVISYSKLGYLET
ncbi:GGDEF domain-containing protein [Desulfitobacterium sp. Sab5]|uniref:GGDEF domain-containing protein n=1 Tax=Desulfitobacterium nosdiversum TaxID=3375356 RepID=UPI003CFB0EB0